MVCVASKFHQEIMKFDVEKISDTFSSNVGVMDLSFLLCSSGMYVANKSNIHSYYIAISSYAVYIYACMYVY